MPTAKWNGQVIAESDKFETVEGNVYQLARKTSLFRARMSVRTAKPFYAAFVVARYIAEL